MLLFKYFLKLLPNNVGAGFPRPRDGRPVPYKIGASLLMVAIKLYYNVVDMSIKNDYINKSSCTKDTFISY